MNFEELNINADLLQAVRKQGYTAPTPIQEQAIPLVLAGRDVLGCAQTGTGKTAAFALPILQNLSAATAPREQGRRTHPSARGQRLAAGRRRGKNRTIRTLVLTPTRELASQIEESFRVYGARTGLRATVIYGGVKQLRQTRALEQGVDILVATPGRLLDLMNQGYIDLSAMETFVLDEADRMLDMGFINDIKKVIAKLPEKRQTLLFSATVPTEIRKLARSLLNRPETVSVTPPGLGFNSLDRAAWAPPY